ncbi:uncharacterized protein [Amphiura filiformis]|uniref:uncharacterized protein n=1 Tax=Amphiura filiformis TaxID=82378 RepID=UPI003B21988C
MAEEVENLFGDDPASVDVWMPKLLDAMKADDSQFGEVADTAWDAIEDKVIKAIKSAKGKFSKQFLDLCKFAAEKRRLHYYKLLAEILEEKSLINTWKDNIAVAEKLIASFENPADLIRTKDDDWWGPDRKPSDCEMGEAIQKCMEHMVSAFGKGKIIKKVNKQLVGLVTKCFQSGKEMHIVVVYGLVHNDMSWDNTEKLYPALFKAVGEWISRDSVDLSTVGPTETSAASQLFQNCFQNSSSPLTYSKEVFISWNECLQHDLEGEPLCSGYGQVIMNILTGFLMKHYGTMDAVRDFVPGVMKVMKCDVPVLVQTASSFVTCIYQQTELLSPCADDVLDVYLEGDSSTRMMLGMALKPLYISSSDKIMRRFSALLEEYEDMPKDQRMMVYMMWEEVAKDQPEKLIPHIASMMEDITNQRCSYQVLSILSALSATVPEQFEEKLDDMVKVADQMPHSVYQTGTIIANVGLRNQEQAERCLKILSEQVAKATAVWQLTLLQQMKRIGLKHKEELNKYRSQIEALKDSPQSGMSETVQNIIDYLEGRSLETLDDQIQETKEDVKNLDNRVTETEKDVDRLDKTVTEQGQDLQNVKNEVNEQGERLDELEEVVDETVEKVEEIDHKTIHNAPKWSRDVSKLLNPEHEYDWRYLAIRLGFNSEDIRNWALSPDPTMAILAEWYTIHKSSEATYAILTALEDMGRSDCTEIIEQALREADQMVPRAPAPTDGEKPPKVFLSYQWDHQPEVKALKTHLEMAGYTCWMDIGQMGGGDQLYAKINEGMRSSKIVLCMCTEKYSKSENCNKEVNLANLLNKPIIPILIDKMAWPPEGSMSMLFAQLLYIQLYNDKEYVRGDKFWEDAKFAELLAQVNYHAAPDQEMITDEYRNWIPQVEDTSTEVKKAGDKSDKNAPQGEQNQVSADAPDVFISYQWGMQPQIKKLYTRLTSMGFRCWLDINQMGGGDPLYTKIDKGLRNAKVVISSVTAKYALSANCRREVSLADALQKPIIPLLMEDSMSWPPEGPMGMTFTQLLYIDFSKEISDQKFEELVQKLKEHASPQSPGQEPVVASVENGSKETQKEAETVQKPLESQVVQAQPQQSEIVEAEDESKKSQKSPKKSPKKKKSPKQSPKKSRPNSAKRSKSCSIL